MIEVPRSRASSRTSSPGFEPLERTSRAAPKSIAKRCASSRLPTTTASPSEIPLWERTSMDCTQTRPDSRLSSPVRSSPSTTSAIARTGVGASSSVEVWRDSRMKRRARSRSVTTPTSAPSSSTMGTRSRLARAIARPAARIGSLWRATGKLDRMTSQTRSITCGSNCGAFTPLRSSNHVVWGLHGPRRTGT